MSGSSTVTLRRRPARTVPASAVAVLLLAAGVGLVWITVRFLVDRRWPSFLGGLHRWATALTWGSAAAVGITLGAVVLGVILLVCAWKPGQPNAMRLQSGAASTGDREFVMSRRSVAKLATASATQLDGVDAVSATVSGRRVMLMVTSPSEHRAEIAGRVTERVRTTLDAAGLAPLPKITTTVRTRSL